MRHSIESCAECIYGRDIKLCAVVLLGRVCLVMKNVGHRNVAFRCSAVMVNWLLFRLFKRIIAVYFEHIPLDIIIIYL